MTASPQSAPRRRPRQLGLEFRTWGGKRAGAGRKRRGPRAGVTHRSRGAWTRPMPLHVTLRMAPHVYNLRSRRSFRVIAAALRLGGDRFDVRVIEFSVQGNHIHLLVEAPDHRALACAVQGLSSLSSGGNESFKIQSLETRKCNESYVLSSNYVRVLVSTLNY